MGLRVRGREGEREGGEGKRETRIDRESARGREGESGRERVGEFEGERECGRGGKGRW